jgi:hypothetical protein
MTVDPKEDSIAEKLEGTRWEYSQSEDRRFLLDPIGRVFGTFRWDGQPETEHPIRPALPGAIDLGHRE